MYAPRRLRRRRKRKRRVSPDDSNIEPKPKRRMIATFNDEATSLHRILMGKLFSTKRLLYKLIPKWASYRINSVRVKTVREEDDDDIPITASTTIELTIATTMKASPKKKKKKKSKPFNIDASSIIEDENHIYKFLSHVLLRMRPTLSFVTTNLYLFEKRCFYVPLSCMSEEDIDLIKTLYIHKDTVMDRRDYYGGHNMFSSTVNSDIKIPYLIRKRICEVFHEYVKSILLRHKSSRPSYINKKRYRDFTVGTQMRGIACAFGKYADILRRLMETIKASDNDEKTWIIPFLLALEEDVSLEGFSMLQCVAGLDIGTHNLPARMM